jgi:hypothetical protein
MRADDEPLPGGGRASAPSVALLTGLAAGAVVILVGGAPALLLDKAEEPSPLRDLALWLSPSLGAAISAGLAGLKMGSSTGRIAALALLALLSAVAITGALDYVLLLGLVAAPTEEPSWTGMLWRRQVLVSCSALIVGALMGVMFGSPGKPRSAPMETRT